MKGFRNYLHFSRQCLRLMRHEPWAFGAFIVLSATFALTEGIGVSLLVPLLETSQGASTSFADIPLLGKVSLYFGSFEGAARIQAVAVALLFIIVLRGIWQYAVDVLAGTLPLRLQRRLSLQGFEAMMAVEMEYITGRDTGTHLNGVSGFPQRISMLLTNLAIIITNLLVFVVYTVIMVSVSWQMTLFSVAFFVVMSSFLRFYQMNVIRRAGVESTTTSAELQQFLVENLAGMKLVRLFAAEKRQIALFTQAFDRNQDNQRRIVVYSGITAPVLASAAGAFICALLYGNSLLNDQPPSAWLGQIMLFLFLLMRLLSPVTQINTARNRVISHSHALDSAQLFLDEMERRRQTNGRMEFGHLREGITFDNVHFRYASEERSTLTGLSTTIPRGSMVAVVGPSGAGKSTLIGLVARLFDPENGRVLVDGTDLRDIDVASWRRRISVVTQDTFIFNDSVANNIAFGVPEASREDIVKAARLAAADEFIQQLADGYETVLGDRGVRLSGGQQQRIAIARAILAGPDLLILDEATSHLDTFTERAIQQAVDQMSRDRTVLIVAHRLSTVRKANKVVVLDQGHVVEEGTHDDLMGRGGLYRQMIDSQRLDLLPEDETAS